MNIREELLKLEDKEYKSFTSKLTKTNYPVIGVRIPLINKLAKDISENSYIEYFKNLANRKAWILIMAKASF